MKNLIHVGLVSVESQTQIFKIRHFVLFLILGFFSSEAFAISAEKCQSTDWFAVGRDNGMKGGPADKILGDQAACQKKGVEISLDQYKKGWEMGMSQYCGTDNAYQLGFKKKSPSKFCPIEYKSDFDQFYKWGKEAFALEKKVKSNDSKLKSKSKALEAATKKKEGLEKEVKKLEEESKALNKEVNGIEDQMKKRRSAVKMAK